MNRETYRIEAEYIIYLLHERRLYAWSLMRIGEVELAEAYRRALAFYPYLPFSDGEREAIFGEDAWHWAMVSLFGEDFAEARPELFQAPEVYFQESDRIFGYE